MRKAPFLPTDQPPHSPRGQRLPCGQAREAAVSVRNTCGDTGPDGTSPASAIADQRKPPPPPPRSGRYREHPARSERKACVLLT